MSFQVDRGATINTAGSTAAWTQDGTFLDADGVAVCAYDDVSLLKAIPIEGDESSDYRVPVGTIGTVLFHSGDTGGCLQLELYWPEGSFVFGYCTPGDVRLHMTNEQKYPR